MIDFAEQQVAPFRHFFISAATDHKFHRLAHAPADALAHHGERGDARQIGELAAHFFNNGPRRATLFPRAQHRDDHAAVEGGGAAEGSRRAHEQALNFTGLHKGHHAAFDFIHVFLHVGIACALRSIDHDKESSSVFFGHVLRGNLLKQPVGKSHQADKCTDDAQRAREVNPQPVLIAAAEALEKPVDAGDYAGFLGMGFEKHGRHNGR